MDLYSFKFLQWALKNASLLQYSVNRPFKFIQGRFWYQSKAHMRLSISL